MIRKITVGTMAAVALASALVGCGDATNAQGGGAAVAYKLGTFERNGQAFVGLVLKDTQVIEVGPANAAFEAGNASAPKLTAPADMKALIARYDSDWKPRLAERRTDFVGLDRGHGPSPPARLGRHRRRERWPTVHPT